MPILGGLRFSYCPMQIPTRQLVVFAHFFLDLDFHVRLFLTMVPNLHLQNSRSFAWKMTLNLSSRHPIILAAMVWWSEPFALSNGDFLKLRMSFMIAKPVFNKLLFIYRATEHSITGRTPAELFLGRRINTVLDILRPAVHNAIDQRQFKMKYKDRHASDREFSPGDPIYVGRHLRHILRSLVSESIQTT